MYTPTYIYIFVLWGLRVRIPFPETMPIKEITLIRWFFSNAFSPLELSRIYCKPLKFNWVLLSIHWIPLQFYCNSCKHIGRSLSINWGPVRTIGNHSSPVKSMEMIRKPIGAHCNSLQFIAKYRKVIHRHCTPIDSLNINGISFDIYKYSMNFHWHLQTIYLILSPRGMGEGQGHV